MTPKTIRIILTAAVVTLLIVESVFIGLTLGYTSSKVQEDTNEVYNFNGHDIRLNATERLEYSSVTRNMNAHLVAHQYVTTHDPLVTKLFAMMKPELDLMTDEQKADVLLTFVHHNILYAWDDVQYGGQYSQFPSETLRLKHGDCEDMAYLLATLYKLAGLDCVLILYDNHMAVGVAVKAQGEVYHRAMSDTDYYLADATGSYTVGGYMTGSELVSVFKDDKLYANEFILIFLIPAIFVCKFSGMVVRGSLDIKNKRIVYTHSRYKGVSR